MDRRQLQHKNLLEDLIERCIFIAKNSPEPQRIIQEKKAKGYSQEYYKLTGKRYVVKGAYDLINEE
jgi:hypothetical protein